MSGNGERSMEKKVAECEKFFEEVGMLEHIRAFLALEEVEETLQHTHERLIKYLLLIKPVESGKEDAARFLQYYHNSYSTVKAQITTAFMITMKESAENMLEKYGDAMKATIEMVVKNDEKSVCWVALKTCCDRFVMLSTEEYGRIAKVIPEEILTLAKAISNSDYLLPEELQEIAKNMKSDNN